jgi:hypothetical protein
MKMTSQYGMMDAIRSAADEMEQRQAIRERYAALYPAVEQDENKGVKFFRMIVDVFGWLSPEPRDLRERAS